MTNGKDKTDGIDKVVADNVRKIMNPIMQVTGFLTFGCGDQDSYETGVFSEMDRGGINEGRRLVYDTATGEIQPYGSSREDGAFSNIWLEARLTEKPFHLFFRGKLTANERGVANGHELFDQPNNDCEVSRLKHNGQLQFGGYEGVEETLGTKSGDRVIVESVKLANAAYTLVAYGLTVK